MAAIFLVILFLPVFVRVSGVEFDLSKLFSLRNILIYLILTLFTGFISGIYPALILSSFNPAKVIRPMPDDAVQGSGLRKILVVIQIWTGDYFYFLHPCHKQANKLYAAK